MSVNDRPQVVYMALERGDAGGDVGFEPQPTSLGILPRFGFPSRVLLDMKTEEIKARRTRVLMEGVSKTRLAGVQFQSHPFQLCGH